MHKKDLRKVPHLNLGVEMRHDTFPVCSGNSFLLEGPPRIGPEMLTVNVEYIDCPNRIYADHRRQLSNWLKLLYCSDIFRIGVEM